METRAGLFIIHGCVIGATVLGGLVAGMAFDRSAVQFNAWWHVGATSWAAFTREADLGRGFILYPIIGIGALALCIGAAIAFRLTRPAASSAAIPIYAAAVLSVAALIVTQQALAPHVLALRSINGDLAALQLTFEKVAKWWIIKTVLHMMTFAANIWALAALDRN